MKTLTLSFLLAGISLCGFSQNQGYQEAMRKNLSRMDSARNSEDFRQVAARFEQIAKVAAQEWLPSYYAGYAYVIMSFMEQAPEQKDLLLDQAEKGITESWQRSGDSSEILVLEAFLSVARITVDPMARGMEYSMNANTLLAQALETNPQNPRAWYLQGTLVYNTPAQFGGGKEMALPILKKANEKFAAFSLPSEFWPNWGKADLERMLQQ